MADPESGRPAAPDDRPRSAQDSPPDGASGPRRGSRTGWVLASAFLAVAAYLFFAGVQGIERMAAIRLTEAEVRSVVHSALRRERADAFLVTGELEVLATTRVRNTRTVLPGVLDLSLGTSSATVRVPGRIRYGVDLAALDREDVHLLGDSLLTLAVPTLVVGSVEPVLERMEVETERGWARLPGRSDREAERRAVELVTPLLREQGAVHLADADQPLVNSARALARIVLPPLQAAGLPRPVLDVVIGSRTVTVLRDGRVMLPGT